MYIKLNIQYICILLLATCFINRKAEGQVVNDNIENRLQLFINTPVSSNTTDCTLQLKCLNRKLTRKCIQYHNDQWFFFKTSKLTRYYLNISKQDCRDLRGVQIVIIDGKACEPESYNIIKCISLGNQNDVFVLLDSLKSDKEYLVLIDGYLQDFCSFTMEFSDNPKGLPLSNEGILSLKIVPDANDHLKIYWSIPDSLADRILKYEIYRRHETEFKSKKIHEEPQSFNAHGTPRIDYVIDEILPGYGDFYYKIIGVGEHERLLISKNMIGYSRPKPSNDSKKQLELELNYPKECNLKISIYDASNQDLLYQCDFRYNLKNRWFTYEIEKYIDQGILNYRIEVKNLETNEKRSHLIYKR